MHRMPGGGHASVYAYANELDEWLESGGDRERDGSQDDAKDTRGDDDSAPENPKSSAALPLQLDEAKALASPPKRRTRLRPFVVLGGLGLLVGLVTLRRDNLTITTFHAHSPVAGIQTKSARTTSGTSSSEMSQAHDFCLKGRYEWNQRTPASLNRALDSFTQAVVHDPDSDSAYVGLADTYLLLREYSTMSEKEAYSRAFAAASKAVQLNDSSAEAHRALAFVEINSNWNFATGEKEFRRAIELNPTDPVAHRWYANAIAVPGRFSESLAEINKAQELDPTSHSTLADKGLMLFKAGKTNEAIELLMEVERTDPAFRSPHFYLMNVSLLLRDYPTYLVEGQKAAQSVNDHVLQETIAAARAGYTSDGERGFLQALYAKQKQFYREGEVSGTMLAKTCIAMGRRQEALSLLEEDYARHSATLLWCLSEPDLLTLKNEPRYQQLVRKIRLHETSEGQDATTMPTLELPANRVPSGPL